MNDTNPCSAQVEKLTAYILDELTSSEAAAVETHIASCAHCADEVLALRATVAQLRAMPATAAVLDGGRRARLVSEARAAVGARRRINWFPFYAAAAAVLVFASVVLVVSLMQTNKMSATPDAEVAKGPAVNEPASPSHVVRIPAGKDSMPAPAYDPTRKRAVKDASQRQTPTVVAAGSPESAPTETAPTPFGAYLHEAQAPALSPQRTGINDALGLGGAGADSLSSHKEALGRAPADQAPPADRLPGGTIGAWARDNEPLEFSYSTQSPERRVEEILRSLAPRPGETPDMMFFRYYGDNPCLEAGAQPLSTFSVDVDTASYTLARNYLSRGNVPPKEAVRTEEFVNYFRGGYPAPKDKDLAIYTELAPTPFAHEPAFRLLRIGIKARETTAEKRLPCALVFVIDCSGSMGRENRLELVKQALRLLVARLDERDTIGIVMFQTSARVVLEPVGVEGAGEILLAIDNLSSGGTTNAGDGLLLGYEMASRRFLEGGNNRVILCSDGVANTGVVDPDAILNRVRGYREQKIFLTSIGVGMGNHNDALLERLADAGDGQCVYVDRMEEARKLFTEKLVGTLETVAKDAKVQVAFDPAHVVLYRQLGYENRALADKDFRNDAVDAGEIGAGHEVTALYEVMPLAGYTGRIATVTVRYKPVSGSTVRDAVEIAADVSTDRAYGSFENASPWMRLDAVVAEFSEILRQSYWARGSTLARLLTYAEPLAGAFPDDKDVAELVALLKQAQRLQVQPPAGDEVVQTIEALKENRILSARLARLQTAEDARALDDLRKQNETLERRILDLLQRRMQR